jgi:poly(A) polymerase
MGADPKGVLLYAAGLAKQTNIYADLGSFRASRSRAERGLTIHTPLVLTRAEHSVSRSNIAKHALTVLHRLRDAGHASLLVGGCVRDLMLGRTPKDFDVVTDARPERIREIFRNARLIGRRFRLAHVHFGRDIVEVATFRALPQPDDDGEGDAYVDNNIFGSQEEDALRRDFTVNALYYDIRDFSVVDYVGGAADLRAGLMRVIGDPEKRFREDPVRMLRAVRFAAKLGFRLEAATEAPIRELGPLILGVPPARLYEEVLKLFHGGYALQTFELLRHYDLFKFLFPLTDESLSVEDGNFPLALLPKALANTDARVNEGKSVNPAFLYAAMLWEPVRLRAREMVAGGMTSLAATQSAGETVLQAQLKHVSIPKRVSFPMREIWTMQDRFPRRSGKQPARLLAHPRFRAAYDFLLLRADAGEAPRELADWWTEFQSGDDDSRVEMTRAAAPPAGEREGGARRRRPRKRRSARAKQALDANA